MLQRIDLCEFQPKQAYALASVASSRWNSRTKMGKSKEIHTLKKTRVSCSVGILFKIRLVVLSGFMCVINVSEI